MNKQTQANKKENKWTNKQNQTKTKSLQVQEQ
jgi:hypothetical protein